MDLDRRSLLLGTLGTLGTAAAAGTLTACSGRSAQKLSSPAESSSLSAPPAAADTRPRWPLTGRVMRDSTDGQHAAVAVKVPDNENEHPQAGIDQADIVYVELDGYRGPDGYSGTRLVPIFHSSMADDVAPVRSIRPVDVAMLSPIGALIGSTGGTAWVLAYAEANKQYIDGPDITYLETKGSGSYSIDPSRVRTLGGVTYYDRAVVCHPKILSKQTTSFRSGPRQAYFPWAATKAEVSTVNGQGARLVKVPWKAANTYDMTYTWSESKGRYLRSMPWGPHVTSAGVRVAPDNIMVILAAQRYGRLYPGKGGVEPIHDIIDTTGTFYYFHGGRYVAGTWSKGAVEDLFTFVLADGSPLKMASGQTYIELARAGAHLTIQA